MRAYYDFWFYILLLLVLGKPFTTSVTAAPLPLDASAYEIRPRPSHQSTTTAATTIVPKEKRQSRKIQEWQPQDETNISFDGNVADIQRLALRKAAAMAKRNENENNSIDENSQNQDNSGETKLEENPTENPWINPLACDGSTLTQTETVLDLRFDYTLETLLPAGDDAIFGSQQQQQSFDAMVSTLEVELQNRLSKIILSCEDIPIDSVIKEANIVGLVQTPNDEPAQEQMCIPENPIHGCTDMKGRMKLFLADDQRMALAENVALWHVKQIMESPAIIQAVGSPLVKVIFAGPPPTEPSSQTPKILSSSSASILTPASIAVISTGAAAVVIFVLAICAWRRTRNSKESSDTIMYDDAPSQAAGRSIHGEATNDIDEENGPSSPFSEMLPSAYRYSENMSILSGRGLSAVTEVSEENTSLGASLSGSMDDIGAMSVHDNIEIATFELPQYLIARNVKSPERSGGYKRWSSPATGDTNPTGTGRDDNAADDDDDDEESRLSDDFEISPRASNQKAKTSELSPSSYRSTRKNTKATSLLLGMPSSLVNTSSTHEDDALLFLCDGKEAP